MDKNKIAPRAFRLSEETVEKFKSIATEMGSNQQQTMARLIEVYESEKGKRTMPDMQETIDTFESHIAATSRMFMESLHKIHDMRSLIRTEYDALLRSKDQTIAELQDRTRTAEQIAKDFQEKEAELLKQNEKLLSECEEKEKRYDLEISKHEEQVSALNNRIKELNEKLEKKAEAEEESKKLMRTLLTENDTIKNEIGELRQEHEAEKKTLIEEISILNNKIKEKDETCKAAQRDAANIKMELEYFRKASETELKLALQTQENALNKAHKEELDKQRTELDRYKDLYYQKG